MRERESSREVAEAEKEEWKKNHNVLLLSVRDVRAYLRVLKKYDILANVQTRRRQKDYNTHAHTHPFTQNLVSRLGSRHLRDTDVLTY